MKALGKFFVVLTVASLVPLISHATALLEAAYDSTTQTLHLQVAYRGGNLTHHFSLQYDECQVVQGQKQIAARLLDSAWDDAGHREIVQTLKFDLSGLECKPALLTIRSGKYSHKTLYIE